MPTLNLKLRGMIQADALARAVFAKLFPERRLDLSHVVFDRRVGDTREVWWGAASSGLSQHTTYRVQITRDEELESEGDPVLVAGDQGDARWLRIEATALGSRVRIACDDTTLLDALHDDVYRIGCRTSVANYEALGVFLRLAGFGQDPWGRGPFALETARVPPHALDPQTDATLAEDLAILDRASAEGSRRAALAAAALVARNGDAASGLARLDAILAASPDEPDARGLRLLLLARARRTEEALAEAGAFSPTDGRGFVAKAMALVEMGKLSDAIAFLDGPRPSDVLEEHAAIAAAGLTERAGDRDAALMRARAIVARWAGSARAYAERGIGPWSQPLLSKLALGDWWRETHGEVTKL